MACQDRGLPESDDPTPADAPEATPDPKPARGGRVDRPPPSKRTLALLITPIIGLVIASYVGDALTTSWAESHPLALTALNARNRVLVLTTNQLDAVSYYVVGGLRLLVSDPLFFILGMLYGDNAIKWVERKSPTFGEQIRLYESAFAKASYPLVFVMPNNYICLFAGAAGMPLAAFIALNVTGTIARLYIIRVVGDVFSKPIDGVLDFFAEYRIPLLVASVALVVGILVVDRFRGKSEIGSLLELEHELANETTTADDDETPS